MVLFYASTLLAYCVITSNFLLIISGGAIDNLFRIHQYGYRLGIHGSF